jgi:anti-sigma regulatory factor (Ser/Thr protein kinase)
MHSVNLPHPQQRAFPAQINLLSEVLDFVTSICAENGYNQNTVLRVRLVIEELFTNSVHHGYRHRDGLIWLTAHSDNQRLQIGYQDEAVAYNPLAVNEAALQAMHANADYRPVGGLGIILIANLVDGADYRYQDGRNVLDLVFSDREK